jgi:hypothetical protein
MSSIAFGATLVWRDLVDVRNRAISERADRPRLLVGESSVLGDVTPSVSVDEKKRGQLEALRAVYEEASLPGWDGYGAEPVSKAILAQALAFLDILPSTSPSPDVSAHPDGEVAFEWYFGRGRVLSVSVNEAGRLSYAALFGYSSQHGTEFLLDSLPEAIALALRRLYSESVALQPSS